MRQTYSLPTRPPGWDHVCEVFRPENTATVVETFYGYAHIGPAADQPVVDQNGALLVGHCQVPYGAGLRQHDLLRVTFKDGTKETYRVTEVRDNHLAKRADLTMLHLGGLG